MVAALNDHLCSSRLIMVHRGVLGPGVGENESMSSFSVNLNDATDRKYPSRTRYNSMGTSVGQNKGKVPV